jgi:hypothetical protein
MAKSLRKRIKDKRTVAPMFAKRAPTAVDAEEAVPRAFSDAEKGAMGKPAQPDGQSVALEGGDAPYAGPFTI